MKKISLLVGITLLFLVGFTDSDYNNPNEGVQSKIAVANQIVTLEDSTQLGESRIVRSIKGIEDSLKGVENSLSEIENDILGDIESSILIITALFALGFIVLKAIPQVKYLHKLNLKDSERLSYDLSNPNTRDKYSLYIIFASVAMIILLIVLGVLIYPVVTPIITLIITLIIKILGEHLGLSVEIQRNIILIILIILIIILIVVALRRYTVHLKKVEKDRKKKVLTVNMNNNENDIWFLLNPTDDGDFIFSKELDIEEHTKETIKNVTEKNSKNIKITNSLPKLRCLTKKEVIDSFYGYAEVEPLKKNEESNEENSEEDTEKI